MLTGLCQKLLGDCSTLSNVGFVETLIAENLKYENIRLWV